MSSRRVIRRHQPLITLRIPFEVQPLPPPPTITLRKNFHSVLTKSSKNPPPRRLPFFVPTPIFSSGTAAKFSHIEDHAAPEVQQTTKGDRNRAVAVMDGGDDDYESDLSDIDSLPDLPALPQASPLIGKIPKPPGEAGRPKSGGFNLEETLGWPKEYFNTIQKQTHDLVTEHLDESKSYNKHPSYKIDRICRKMELDFARLHDYEHCWPIRCIIKSKLKSSSEIARRQGAAKPLRSRVVRETQLTAPDQ